MLILTFGSCLVGEGCLVDFADGGGPGQDAHVVPDAAPGCGDGVRAGAEACDGTDLGSATCESLGHAPGTLLCDAWCRLDPSGCDALPGCGDGVLQAGELCDDGQGTAWDGCRGCVISELLVNQDTAGNQVEPAVAPLGDGFVVVFSAETGGGTGARIVGHRFDIGGARVGPALAISADTGAIGERSRAPAVIALPGGGFAVAWIRDRPGEQAAMARIFDGQATPLGDDFAVSDLLPEADEAPALAPFSDGSFLAVWIGRIASADQVLHRSFDGSGAPLDAATAADTDTATLPAAPRVAVSSADNALLAWTAQAAGGQLLVHAQQIGKEGLALGPRFPVPDDVSGWHEAPDVAATPDGGYVVVWQGLLVPAGGTWDIFARRLDSVAAPLGPDLPVTGAEPMDQRAPAVAAGSAGILVTWESQVGADWDVMGQSLDLQGAPVGAAFRVHTHLEDWQTASAAARLAPDRFVVTWQSDLQDGDLWGIFAQRFTADGSALGAGL